MHGVPNHMPAKHQIGTEFVLTGEPYREPERRNQLAASHYLQAHSRGAQATSGKTPEASQCKGRWEIVGKVVAFSPDLTDIKTRYFGEVVRVEDAPDYAGLPSCRITIRGKSGKLATIDYTKHYAQTYQTWKDAENEQRSPAI